MPALLRIALLLFAGGILACGEDRGPTLSLRALSVRQDSPLPIDVTFDSRGPGLIEGTLEFRFTGADENPQVHRTNEIAITPGRSTQRMLLPPVHLTGRSLEAHVLLHGKGGTLDLGKHPLAVWNSAVPPLRVAVCLGGRGWPQGGEELWRSLQLRTYADDASEAPPDVVQSWIDPADAPAHVLAWCAYDLVIVGGPGFRAMREKPLASLARWVRAGGSVLVLADNPVKDTQLAFLNELTGESGQRFSTDESERLRRSAGFPPRLHADFGRAVVLPDFGQPPAEWVTPRWRGDVAFLWKVHTSLIPTMMSEGLLILPRLTSRERWDKANVEPGKLRGDVGHIVRSSLPDHITPLPFSFVALIFLAFTLLIGPVDRVLLRRLHLTRWTWVVFPIVCLGFTWLMVALANAHLGRADYMGTFRIRDVGADGTVIRETRIETLFAGRSYGRVTRLAGTTIQDLEGTDDFRFSRDRRHSANPDVTTAGSLLGGYDFRQNVRQWEARTTVSRSFEHGPDDYGFDWSAIPKVQPSWNEWAAIRRKLDPGLIFQLGLRPGWASVRPSPVENPTLCRGLAPREFNDFLSQSSPRPGAPLDDLALIDNDDPGAHLVVAMRRTGPRDVTVWRRVIRWSGP